MESKYLSELDGEVAIKPDILAKLKDLKDRKDQLEKEYKEITRDIVNECKERFTETTKISGFNFTLVGNFGSVKFNEDKFKRENLALYLAYLEPSFTEPSYKLVPATRKKKGE